MAAHSRNAVAVDLIQDDMPELFRGGESAPHAGQADDLPTLRLDDLIQDDNGEVVLFNDSGLRALAVATEAGVVAEGSSGHHVTAAGDDVSGFHYVTFTTGLTLYYESGLEVIVRGDSV